MAEGAAAAPSVAALTPKPFFAQLREKNKADMAKLLADARTATEEIVDPLGGKKGKGKGKSKDGGDAPGGTAGGSASQAAGAGAKRAAEEDGKGVKHQKKGGAAGSAQAKACYRTRRCCRS